ncbi:MAG: hypothetical protein WC524_01655 [Candidatus Aminicenantales bacterium]
MIKKVTFLFAFWLLLILTISDSGLAQTAQPNNESDQVMIVQRGKPGRLVGTVTYENEKVIRIRKDDGSELTIEKNTILSMVKGKRYGNSVVARDPNSSRSVIGPTARPLGSGQGYVALSGAPWPGFLAPTVSFGLGGFLSLNAGVIITKGDLIITQRDSNCVFLKDDSNCVFLNGKISFVHRPKLNVAAGAVYLNLPRPDYYDEFGAIYGIGTFGGEAASFNVGLGLSYYSGEDGPSGPIYIIGGEFLVSPRVKALVENWTTEQGFNLTCVGFRFLIKNLALDVSVAIPWSSDGLKFRPMISPVFNFGRR